mgnify:CR=1 FL=1
MFWFKKNTLQERVDAQKAKDLRNALRTWEHGVEPFLIKQGFSVKMISDYKKLYFSDSRVEFELVNAYRWGSARLLPRIDSKSGKAKWSLRPVPDPKRSIDRGAPTKPTKQ